VSHEVNIVSPTEIPNTQKKGKFRNVVAACIATVILGGISGFGGAYLWSGVSDIYNETKKFSIDRENAPLIPSNSEIDFMPGTDTLTVPNFNSPYTAEELFEAVSDTVVGTKLTQKSFHLEEDTGIIGSGVIYTTDGFIITCEHVISGASKVFVVVNDYNDPTVIYEYEAAVVGYDQPTDIAVLKITRDEPFKAAGIGNSGELKVGRDVCAIGNPVGLEKSMTKGIISGLQRDLGDDTYELPSIQTDTALNMGNSGCPLFDMYGNVIGIVNKKIVYGYEIDNLGFAISIDEAKPIINELVKNGSVTSRAMLGISAKELNAYNAATLGVDVEAGLYVESVRANTPAAESGLSRGDVIVKIDGKSVASISDVQSIIKNKNAGDIVEATVIRYDNYGDRKEIKISFALTTNS
jgi:serine protease Do